MTENASILPVERRGKPLGAFEATAKIALKATTFRLAKESVMFTFIKRYSRWLNLNWSKIERALSLEDDIKKVVTHIHIKDHPWELTVLFSVEVERVGATHSEKWHARVLLKHPADPSLKLWADITEHAISGIEDPISFFGGLATFEPGNFAEHMAQNAQTWNIPPFRI